MKAGQNKKYATTKTLPRFEFLELPRESEKGFMKYHEFSLAHSAGK
jgi:hypothetical protein